MKAIATVLVFVVACGTSSHEPSSSAHDATTRQAPTADAAVAKSAADGGVAAAPAVDAGVAAVDTGPSYYCAFDENHQLSLACGLEMKGCDAARTEMKVKQACERVPYVACFNIDKKAFCFSSGWACAAFSMRDTPACKYRCADKTTNCAPTRDHEAVHETKAVAGVAVTVGSTGTYGWAITIQNNTSDTIRVYLDDSSYVNHLGAAQGRLIRTSTRMGAVGQTQAPSSVPSSAKIVETVVPENWIELVRHPVLLEEPSSTSVGRLVVSIETSNGKATWEGEVRNPDR